MALSQQWLDELRARTTLSALIGKTMKLTKAGREFKGCCPFHNEKTASFYVNDEKQMYHCFGCSAHGDAIRWMTDQRGLQFIDAVKELAAAAGMEVPARSASAKKEDDQRLKLIEANEAAARWFEEQLASPAGADVRAYLDRRSISPDIQKRFRIGFAPDKREGLKVALSSFGLAVLIEAGLLISVEDKEPYDRFRGRLMIPIRDPRGRVIAFGGRIMGDGQPKYLNSPDTPLFDKGRALYNYDVAAVASRKSGRLVAVEGYMDSIACVRAGIEEVIAPLGTALTERQLELMWRLAPNPVLCFDGDAAGQKAAIRAAERALPMIQPGNSLSIACLPSGQDPDDIITKQGPAAFRSALSSASTLVDHLWNHVTSTMPIGTPEEKAALRARLWELANTIKHPGVKKGYVDEFKQRLNQFFAPAAPPPAQDDYRSQPRRDDRKKAEEPKRDLNGAVTGLEDILQRTIAGICLRFPSLCSQEMEALSMLDLGSEMKALIWALVDIALDRPSISTAEMLSKLTEQDLRGSAEDIIGDHRTLFRDAPNEVASAKLRKLLSLDALMKSEASARARMQQTGSAADIAHFRQIEEHLMATRRSIAN